MQKILFDILLINGVENKEALKICKQFAEALIIDMDENFLDLERLIQNTEKSDNTEKK